MTKKYKCRLSASSLLVNCNGKVMRLEFEPDVISIYGMRGCSYTTDKEKIQRAIERSKRFNSHQHDEIWTDDVEVRVEMAVEAPKKPVETKKTIRRIKSKKED